jgi:hypothetical protein
MRRSPVPNDGSFEYRYPIPGAVEGSDILLRFDGRVIEYFNLYSGASARLPYPETHFERSEPDRKDRVTFKFRTQTDNIAQEFEVGGEHVAEFDDFLAKIERSAGGR